MKVKKIFVATIATLCLFFALVGPATTQSDGQRFPALKASALVPVADGVVASGEYAWQAALKDMKLSLSLSADSSTLYVALEAPTTGWVAVGLGSTKMNNSFMVLAYVDKSGAAISEQTGAGFGHKENTLNILRTKATQEANGSTILEYSLPAAAYTSWPSLKLIVAYGRSDNFTSKHAKYGAGDVAFAK